MFAKLRRRHRPTAAPAPAPTSVPQPEIPQLDTADHEAVSRMERVRAAVLKAGADPNTLGPEPSWLADARTRTVPLGDTERAELTAYLGSATTICVTSDKECDKALSILDNYTAQRELAAVGMYVENCSADLPADVLRAMRDAALEAQRTNRPSQAP